MKAVCRLWAFAAAASGVAGCGDRAPDQPAAPAGGGVTIELPERTPAAVAPETANAADENPLSNFVVADPEPVPEAEAPAPMLPREEVKPAREEEPAEDAATPPPAEKVKAPPPPPAQGATPPLPNAVIVRTLEKIGYSCGSIVSSSKIEGASGSSDYRITCSSGASYRASNRTGRYRFSKAD
jgi:hypothetical protein